MRAKALPLLLILLASAAPAAETTGQTPLPSGLELQLGESDFRIYCATCHGVDGTGTGPVADFLTLQPADLTQLARKAGGKFPADMLARIIDGRAEVKAHGPRDMPVWGDYFAAEKAGASKSAKEQDVAARIEALVVYLQSLQAR